MSARPPLSHCAWNRGPIIIPNEVLPVRLQKSFAWSIRQSCPGITVSVSAIVTFYAEGCFSACPPLSHFASASSCPRFSAIVSFALARRCVRHRHVRIADVIFLCVRHCHILLRTVVQFPFPMKFTLSGYGSLSPVYARLSAICTFGDFLQEDVSAIVTFCVSTKFTLSI